MAEATFHAGDCRDVLAEFALFGRQFDACVCDPPYHLTSIVRRFGGENAKPAKHGKDGLFARQSKGFMGKQWDGGNIAADPETWRAVYDVLKPGAHLLAFGGTRTFHRMTCAIEDAGFEIRNCVMWLYGTGFPKSQNVAKFIDKELGVVGTFGEPKSAAHAGWIDRGRMRGDDNEPGWQRPGMDDPEQVANAARIYIPGTPEAAEFDGWGTDLKPAWEPIIVARKPLGEKTVAANVLKFRTGAMNIDASRIELDPADPLQDGVKHSGAEMDTACRDGAGWGFKAVDRAPGLGRWPANVIHDGSDEVMAAFPQAPGQAGRARNDGEEKGDVVYGAMKHVSRSPEPRGDSGSAARFFYCAKATAKDRAGSSHPTVKPLALMRYLCTLVTPPGGAIVDPFAGSGTTLQAAVECGFDAVGIEADPDYALDIERRLAVLQPGYEDPAEALAAFA